MHSANLQEGVALFPFPRNVVLPGNTQATDQVMGCVSTPVYALLHPRPTIHGITAVCLLKAFLIGRCASMNTSPGERCGIGPHSDEQGVHAVGTPVRYAIVVPHHVCIALSVVSWGDFVIIVTVHSESCITKSV